MFILGMHGFLLGALVSSHSSTGNSKLSIYENVRKWLYSPVRGVSHLSLKPAGIGFSSPVTLTHTDDE